MSRRAVARLAAGLFALATLASTSALLPPRRAAVVAAVSLLGAGAAWRGAGRLGAALLGLAAAGCWLTLLAPPLPDGLGVAGAVVVGCALLLALLPTADGLPRGVRLGVLVVGAVESLRLLLLGAGEGSALVLGAAVVAGAAGAPGRRGLALGLGLLLALGAGVQGLRGATRMATPPSAPSDLRELARLGALDRHADALAADPALGLAAVRLAPRSQQVARRLSAEVGLDRVLAAGWAPTPEGLSGEQRAEVAMILDGLGRGGEGLRLLRGDRDGVGGWTRVLLARAQGGAPPALAPASLQPPAEAHRLPGRGALPVGLLEPGGASILVHAEGELASLGLDLRAEAGTGPAVLEVSLDGANPVALPLPAAGVVEVGRDLPPGPHRLQLTVVDPGGGIALDAVVGTGRGP